MDNILDLVNTLLSFVFILSTIVFIHEGGHYLVAKWCGVKIDTFAIGFGKELFGFYDRSGTRWKVCTLPLGGYVKMFGDAGAASTADNDVLDAMTEAEKAVSFHHKPLWKKSLVVAAGPFANFLLTIIIMTGFLYANGITSTEPVVGEIVKDSPAQAAGLQAGDRILRVDGEDMKSFGDIPRKIATNLGTPLTLDIQRGDEHISLTLTPKEFTEKDPLGNTIKRPLIGIKSQKLTLKDVSFAGALWLSVKETYHLCEISLRFLGQMITGDRSADDLQGPIGIAKMSGQVTQSGETTGETIRMIFWFMAMLSANLGLVNLLPVPMLDGGHLVFYGLEALRGRPLAQKFQEFGFRVGFLLIASLMGFTLFNDIRKIIL